ncbi:DUF3565 domain-containing protein [Pseudomonas duriflava]|uniref:DUF3565 domain-containing protein n=1 Tax=Pseudomonas duriflava TaxID=459528 RepID=UPI003CC7CAC1
MNEISSVRVNAPDCDPQPVRQTSVVVGFIQDAQHHWTVQLSCGHSQHLRHDPPWQQRAWVLDPAQRAVQIGKSFPCGWCNRNRAHMLSEHTLS